MSEYILKRAPSCRCVARLAFLAILLFGRSLFADVNVTQLRCEQLENPLGIDVTSPRLSWVLSASRRGVRQTAYQVLVASAPSELKPGQADLWDSGKVSSDQSILVRYEGKPLASHIECFWKVRVWDNDGRASEWSAPAKWSMGLLSESDWKARWIGLDGVERTNALTDTSWIWYPEGEPQKSAPVETNWFRRVISIPPDRKIKRALFEYTGDNECRGWLNEFDLGARNNFKTVKWNDITSRLESGKTYVFGLVGRNEGTNENPAGVIGRLTIEFDAGEPMMIRTDEGWKVSKRFEQGWNTPSFDDSKWVAAKVIGPANTQPWGEPRSGENRQFPARWLRKEFAVEKKVARATVYFCGLGSSELYLNGAKVGDAVLSPALSQYDKRVFYVTYDVTKQLRRGANAMSAVLGGGRFASDRSKVYAGTVNFGWPKMILHLRLQYADGSIDEVVSDASWKLTTDGPILSSGEFDGEEYDARKELRGWSKVNYDTAAWLPAQVVSAPPGKLSAQMTRPIRVVETLRPISVKEVKPGVFIYDMGQNMVGWCRLKVRGPAGMTVQLRFAETLNPDGTLYMANLRGARVTDTYTLSGRGGEVWSPRFTYHGFRYVEMTGFPGKPTLNALEGRVVNDDLPVAGQFECSNELLNQIYRNVYRGTRGNYRSIPTDCPQRDERQGWLGDRSEECRGESFLFDISAFYPKWLQDISDAQRDSGSVPDVAPAYWPIYSDNVTWPSTLVTAPGMLHRQYGDLAPVAGRYDSAKKWLNYMKGFFTNGVIAKDSYGDWCVPPEDLKLIHSKDPARQTDKALLATAYFYYDLKLMERYAGLLGKIDDAMHFAQWADEIKAAFNQRFLIRESGQYDNGSQTSCVLPLAFGLVPDDQRAKVFNRLVDKIENETKGHIGTGLIGGQHLMRVLSDNGRADLAYRIASQKDYPGWGYMISQGATTIWELWNGNTADPTMNSGNHVMLVGDLVIWFYEYLAGIAADPEQPGFKHIVMKPHPVADLKFVKASHRSPYGLIVSDWRKEGGMFSWKVEVPANTSATVYVPKMSRGKVSESGKTLEQTRGAKLLRAENDRIVLQLDSGKYHLTSE
ncbi:MAG TPA: family 78 glycoside hydrolase catalytic domain [Verrucomicrobiae bacterium]|nr:family 78 glycoside hydrolase catalytic domain [Verrucomicrobiae bacterium]